jgi:hypothetical protein
MTPQEPIRTLASFTEEEEDEVLAEIAAERLAEVDGEAQDIDSLPEFDGL